MASSTLFPHAAFFVDDAPIPDLGTLLDGGPLLAIAGGVLLALGVWAIASTCADPRRNRCAVRWLSEVVSGVLSTLTPICPIIARVALGATLLWCAAMGSIATPNLHVDLGPAMLLRGVAAALGIALVLGIRVRIAALLTIATFVFAAFLAGTPIVVFERLDIAGLAAFVAIVGGSRLQTRMDGSTLARLQFGATWLRGMVALGLVTVAVTEKLANVPMTTQVLEAHPHVNVGLVLGTDAATTVLMLGAVEIAFAILVLLLPLPELMALAIGAPFVLSVGEFGLLEVPGHLPVWGAVVVLALLGAHLQTADLVTIRPPWLRHARRTPDAARERLVGAAVPWVESPDVPVTTILVGGANTLAAPRTEPPVRAAIPVAPPIAPAIAAWLGAEPVATASVTLEPLRFEWAPHAGAGVPTSS